MAGGGRGESPAEREARVGAVAARLVAEQGLGPDVAEVLVVDDVDGATTRAVKAAGAHVVPWRRYALDGAAASAWPPACQADLAILRLPRDWASFELQVHAACARLRPGGRLWVVGGNDEGIKSAPRTLEPLLGPVETLWIKARTRVLEAVRPAAPPLRDDLESWAEALTLDLPGCGPTALTSYPGLFAHGRLDAGTALLLAHLPPIAPGARVLDYGCGPGAISLAVAHRQPAARLYGCDVDAIAVHAARRNLPDAQVLLGDGWAAVELGARFDVVLSNPPLHQGQAEDRGLLHRFAQQLPLRLRDGGQAVVVSWRQAAPARVLAEVLPRVEVLAEDSRYQVVRAAARGA